MQVFLTGHGGWSVKNGYFKIPRSTTVTFYTLNAKLMLSTDVYKIVAGTYGKQPEQVLGEYRMCQNMTLYPDDQEFINPTLSALMKNPNKDNCDVVRVLAPVNLKDIIEGNPGHDFVWACCRDLSMKSTSGFNDIARDAGINAGQSTGGFVNFDKQSWNWSGGYYKTVSQGMLKVSAR